MGKLTKNNSLDALLKTMLFSAIVHVSILYPHSVIKGEQSPINIFNILDLDLLFPGIELGTTSFILSYIFIFGVFATFYRLNKKKETLLLQSQHIIHNAEQNKNNILPFDKKVS